MIFDKYPDITEEKITKLLECCQKQADKIEALREDLLDKSRKLEYANKEIAELYARVSSEAAIRPSLEVLQRMANGLDPFDRGRFQCAVAALPHETPKLSASVIGMGRGDNWGDQLDAAKARRSRLRVIDAEPA